MNRKLFIFIVVAALLGVTFTWPAPVGPVERQRRLRGNVRYLSVCRDVLVVQDVLRIAVVVHTAMRRPRVRTRRMRRNMRRVRYGRAVHYRKVRRDKEVRSRRLGIGVKPVHGQDRRSVRADQRRRVQLVVRLLPGRRVCEGALQPARAGLLRRHVHVELGLQHGLLRSEQRVVPGPARGLRVVGASTAPWRFDASPRDDASSARRRPVVTRFGSRVVLKRNSAGTNTAQGVLTC